MVQTFDDQDDELKSSQDFIMTEGFQKDMNESNDVWLIMGNSPVKTNDEGTRWCKGGGAALVSSAKKRDEFIDRHKGSHFKNGYTVTRASNMQELRDELCTIVVLPPRQEKEEIQSQTQSQSQSIIHPTGQLDLDEIKRFELFRSVIQHEDDLLNQRVSWIILAQSFLMAAFITSSGPNSLRYVTAIVGLATVLVTMPAIVAAGKNIEVQQEVYFKMLLSDERSKELHGHQRGLVKDEDESTRRIEDGHLLPTMAFRGRGAVRILKTVVILAAVQFFGWVFLLLALILDM
jgi:hypothetical protein